MVRNAAELEAALALVKKTAQVPELTADMGRGLVEIVSRYTQTFLLQRYDEGLLTEPQGTAGDSVDSRWTLTVSAWLLRKNGSGEVWPMVCWGHGDWRTRE